jgi:hypothetical protein
MGRVEAQRSHFAHGATQTSLVNAGASVAAVRGASGANLLLTLTASEIGTGSK